MKNSFTFFIGFALMSLISSCKNTAIDNQLIVANCCEDAGATCSSKGTCNACKNCKYCTHCSKNGGSCSVCR